MENTLQINAVVHTCPGTNCLWHKVAKPVQVLHATLDALDTAYGTVNVYFDTNTWDVETDGLIYTDAVWLESLKGTLKKLGFTNPGLARVSYSEQGMQGTDFVNLDVDFKFIVEWRKFVRAN